MSSKNITVLQNKMMQYRLALFEKLMFKGYNVKVICSKNQSDLKNNVEILNPIKFFGFKYYPFSHVKDEIILFECDLKIINTYFLMFRKNSISWGMWKTKNFVSNFARIIIANITSSNIFYCNEHKSYFDRFTFRSSKNFVAQNSIDVKLPKNNPKVGSYYISVGSLNERKGLRNLIDSFEFVLTKYSNLELILVGNGNFKNVLTSYINNKSNLLKQRVVFLGEISDNNKLMKLYANAICSVSYSQAGLSILQSLGNATPYITTNKAISGGEIYNIIEGETGFKNISNEKDFAEKMIYLHENKKIQLSMKKKSLTHYNNFASIDLMTENIIKAIKFNE
ncbi:MAG: hypothetical protein CL832_09240 [Crocinitomicaceae bacterium]|nr:hypothetical protein [Crocinitomicaceae bacterium]|tara:strand:- start:1911 stop:2924 length:1014 start_codon:yes stop_codon:yes gene_type:complete